MNLGALLERQAALHCDRPFLTLAENGDTLCYAAFNQRVNRLAHGLRELGVAAGDYVAIMLPNGVEFLLASYALKKLGAIEVAINREFRGPALGRMLRLTGAAMLIAGGEDFAAVNTLGDDLDALRQVVLVGDGPPPRPASRSIRVTAFAAALADRDTDFAPAGADSDTAVILFTSGTTGVSKGCSLPHRAAVRAAESMIRAFDLTAGDCVYTPYPLFHVGAAHYDVLPALMCGARVVLRDGFSVSAFWPEVARHGTTWFMMLGSVQQLLWAAPPCAEERRHRLRFMWGTPLPVDHAAFAARFGIRLAVGGGYGSTDAGAVALPDFERTGGGRVLENFEVAIVDADDAPLPVGETGELVVRPREAAIMSSGYVGMPEATLASRRNLWFHTGDLARLDEDGYLYFVSRMNERIRVRGVMVSAAEVEEVVILHPAVEDCAVLGVPAAHGEDDIKAFVTLRAGASLDAGELREFCRPRMTRHMLPAQIVFLAEMPRTPSGKPAKAELRRR